MPKYNLSANRYFYHTIHYCLNHPYGVKSKVLKILQRNIYTDVHWITICNQIT